MKETAYRYKNLPIPGGGYVTGFLFHPEQRNILYIRTDIGGTYRFDYNSQTWNSLTESVNMYDLSETYPIALATDQENADMLYIISGMHQSAELDPEGKPWGKLSISSDGGKTFVHKKVPFYVHGNLNGRGTGYRLVKDPVKKDTLYFASQKDGLLRTTDLGESWEVLPTGEERHMTFVWCSPDGNTLIAGTAGIDTGYLPKEDGIFDKKALRGHSLYVSYDAGENFEELPMPENIEIPGSKWNGYVAERYDYDGTYFYVTLASTGEYAYIVDMGYSCDCGQVIGGRVLRYAFDEKKHLTDYQDITPVFQKAKDGRPDYLDPIRDRELVIERKPYDFGFSGISSCKSMPGLLALSTICRENGGDAIFISKDYGETWETALFDLSIGNLQFQTPYMKPEYNGGHSLIHWLSDVKINPYDPDEVWFNSGTGVFVGKNFTSEKRSFSDCCKGIEETVHLNVYSPVDGPVQVLDIVGDLGGFSFTDVDSPCENSFADREGNRYITCINADFSDLHPDTVIVTPRGNWKGKTKGGLILSEDYGRTFERLPLPFGISEYLDERFHEIERPNVNSGWAALGSTCENIVYCVAEGIDLYMKGIVTSNDLGKSFQKTRIYSLEGEDLSFSDLHMKVYSDRMSGEVFYGFGDDMRLFVSTDKGNTFHEINTDLLAGLNMGLIDTKNGTEIRGDAGKVGVFYAALGKFGLYKICFHAQNKTADIKKMTAEGEAVYRMGLGLLSPESDYRKDDKALYICGIIQGVYGFFRSFDEGKTWEKINTDVQQFGEINSIDGDSRQFGRFFIATGSFGVKYGEPVCE